VSWDDAVTFCAWDGKKRLLAEAQWECACLGAAVEKKYPWGDREPTAKDAYFGAQNPDTVRGERNRNFFGLCDMIGNSATGPPTRMLRNTVKSLRIAIRTGLRKGCTVWCAAGRGSITPVPSCF